MSAADHHLAAPLSHPLGPPDARTAAEFRAAADARLELKLGGEFARKLLLALGAQPTPSRGA